MFTGGPILGVTGGNQPLTYFNTAQDNPQDFFGMMSLSIPIGGGSGRAKELCYTMADIEVRKKKMDVYLELFERGVVTKEEVDAVRQELFPSPKPKPGDQSTSGNITPQAVISYNN